MRSSISRHRRLIALLIAAALMLALADWWQRNREMDQLLDAVETSEQAIVDGNAQIARGLSESDLASLDAGATSIEREQAIDDARQAVSDAAGDAAADTRAAGAEVEDVGSLPWHSALGDARASYLEHSEAWEDYFKAVAADPAQIADNVLDADISATFRTAEQRFEEALPFWARYDARDRVETIWED